MLDIVNEPTAAALALGETLGYWTPGGEPNREMTLLVYDLGGGTFNATLLRLAPGNIQTIATDGDMQLGGHDWDMRLGEHAAQRFKRLHQRDPRRDRAVMNRILAAVIDAKHTLSARGRVTIRLELSGQTLEVRVTREQFEGMTADLLDRTAQTTRQLLRAAKMEWKDVNRVLLVGGSTRMPMIGRMLRQLSDIEPDQSVNPDEAVARGAALYAAYRTAKESGEGPAAAWTITNVNAHNLGVEGIDPATLRKTNLVLIPRNTPLPARATERFVTSLENQRSIAVQIIEGESSRPNECTNVGRAVIRDLPEGLPKNWPVDVAFEYGADGRLTVAATAPDGRQGATFRLERSAGMSDAGIARWKQPIGEAAGFDAFEATIEDLLRNPPPAVDESVSLSAGPTASFSQAESASEAVCREERAPLLVGPEFPPEAVAASDDEPTADDEDDGKRRSFKIGRRPPRTLAQWVFIIIGHIMAALLGLSLGYLILSRLQPARFPLPW